MESIVRCCAGLDVHKDSVEACVRCLNKETGKLEQETRHFFTMTQDLMEMARWFESREVTQVAMESTGVYWKPIFNIVESRFQVLLVNAKDIKHVPGRKTDVKDCQWIAQLLQHGLLRASFIPPRQQRELRDLTRHRAQVLGEHSRTINRIQKIFEDANLKLGSVASDVVGVSGRLILKAIIGGESNPEVLANLAQRRLREKIPELKKALLGNITEHHRWLLGLLYEQLTTTEAFLSKLDEKIEQLTRPQSPVLEKLDRIPGINRRVAEVVLAEIGPDMSPFPTDAHLASWAGMCPGSNESAGKKKSGKTTKGSRWLRQALVQAAWAASHKKDSYFQAHAQNVMRRRGRKRGLVAVGHSILIVIYHLLKEETEYQDLGANFLEQIRSEHLVRFHVKRLEQLGFKVEVQAMAA
ncbi:MAG TPA: IS110 family transposase [Candidatus Angelobacter sp.]|nr:IS110 family transposase [Candidatus Angelobacter sp.]